MTASWISDSPAPEASGGLVHRHDLRRPRAVPVARHDAGLDVVGTADDLLLMDVARYKYPPFWVDADLLWQAILVNSLFGALHEAVAEFGA